MDGRAHSIRRKHRMSNVRLLSALAAAGLALGSFGCGRSAEASASGKRVIVLGIDGMDPNFVERHWDVLPNLAKLRSEGEFKRLETTMPPQSPVACPRSLREWTRADMASLTLSIEIPKRWRPIRQWRKPPRVAERFRQAHMSCR